MLHLGTETGSLVNHILSQTDKRDPEIGMGVTILGWTDRHPGTIVEIQRKYGQIQPNIIGITCDRFERIDNNGMSEIQEYKFTTVSDGHVSYYKKDGKGNWRSVHMNENGRWIYNDSKSNHLVIGRRERYYDFSF